MFINLFKKRQQSQNLNKLSPYILKNIDRAILVINSNLKIEYVNAGGEKLFKYTGKKLIGKKLEQLFENNPLNPSQPPLIRGGEKDSPPDKGELEGVIIDADNNKIPVTILIKKIEDGAKSPIGFILILTDMSESTKNYRALEEKTHEIELKNESLRKLQKELGIEKISIEDKIKKRADDLKEEHANLLASIDNLSLCFLMTDKYNKIILNNKAAKNIFPLLNEEKTITVTELQKSAQISFDLDIEAKKAMTEKKCINITDIQIDSKFINIFISPIILELKQGLNAIGVSIIIEDQTKQHNLELSKEDFFNIAAHELRTPLTAIYGYTALIKQIYFGNIQNEELKIIINNISVLSKKLSLSVSNFLDSSKLEQGKIELKQEPCNLFAIINESIKEMESVALWKNLYIKFDPPSSPIIINADRIRITQILNILINNSIKYTDNGGISISIEAESNFAKIIIKDTGTGISDENKKLLFRKFQRTGSNLLTRQEGTGLGLHLANLLIAKMGGTINIERTEINKGSTFSFTIPIFNN